MSFNKEELDSLLQKAADHVEQHHPDRFSAFQSRGAAGADKEAAKAFGLNAVLDPQTRGMVGSNGRELYTNANFRCAIILNKADPSQCTMVPLRDADKQFEVWKVSEIIRQNRPPLEVGHGGYERLQEAKTSANVNQSAQTVAGRQPPAKVGTSGTLGAGETRMSDQQSTGSAKTHAASESQSKLETMQKDLSDYKARHWHDSAGMKAEEAKFEMARKSMGNSGPVEGADKTTSQEQGIGPRR